MTGLHHSLRQNSAASNGTQRCKGLSFEHSLSSAHRAAVRSPSSAASAQRFKLGAYSSRPLFPIATATLRRRPRKPVRRTGEPLKFSSNSASSIPASHSSAGLTSSVLASSSGSELSGAFAIPRAHVLADIAPKNLPSHTLHQPLRNRPAMLDGQVRNALCRIHSVGFNQGISGTGFNATPAASAAIRNRKLRRVSVDLKRGQQHREKTIRTELWDGSGRCFFLSNPSPPP